MLTTVGICAFCGAPLAEDGSRTCGCRPRSELEIVTRTAAVLAARESAERDGRSLGQWMRRVAGARRAS